MSKTPSTSMATSAVVALLSALAGFAAVYVTLGRPDNAGREAARAMPPASTAQADPDQSTGLPTGPGVNPLSTGEMTAFVFKKEPEPLPDIQFLDGSGAQRTLKDWQGKVVLLNLW